MSWATRYRPLRFEDVLGQEGTVKILKQIIKENKGFQHSYIFSGPYGMGKTTLGRIFARALLCEYNKEGEPCNECRSCKNIIENNGSESLVEVDAATNSGKDYIRKVIQDLDYINFSNKNKIWLFDEAHQLTKDALDGLLKPMEDNIPGTLDKRLVCIFCTTEPEKMRETIFSRSLYFQINPVKKESIINRLEFICKSESIEYDIKPLDQIVIESNFHIRDSIKYLETLSLSGSITIDNVNEFFNINYLKELPKVFLSLPVDIKTSIDHIKNISIKVYPEKIYEYSVDLLLSSWRYGNNVSGVNKWIEKELLSLYKIYGDNLLDMCKILLNCPKYISVNHLIVDILSLQKFALNISEEQIEEKVYSIEEFCVKLKERVKNIEKEEQRYD